MDVEIGTEAAQSLFWEYLFRISVLCHFFAVYRSFVHAYANASKLNYKSGAVSKLAHGLWKGGGGCWDRSESVEGYRNTL